MVVATYDSRSLGPIFLVSRVSEVRPYERKKNSAYLLHGRRDVFDGRSMRYPGLGLVASSVFRRLRVGVNAARI